MHKRDISAAMERYVPSYYRDLYEANAILDAQTGALEQLNANIDDVLAQFNVSTATWGLAKWESLLGLNSQPPEATWNEIIASERTFAELGATRWSEIGNGSEPVLQERRSAIISRLRGVGTISSSMIKSVAESYSNGEIAVKMDANKYTVTITFVGELGIPASLDKIQRLLRDIIPAHLAIVYKFTYMTFGKLTKYNMTFAELTAKGLTFSELGGYSQGEAI